MGEERINITFLEFNEAPGCGAAAVTAAINKKLSCQVMVTDWHWDDAGAFIMASYQRKQPHVRHSFKGKGLKVEEEQ